ncbi:hypothetical protein OUQ99_30985 [Streptomonospora nanhaiensis]|uniref:Uncharacterized protein n=1 Tax=Streptomonospora nanhaiensis TaxID=1323731 RepID=A0ABY6YMR0_9ACTN|nr:hypothetical protein [Streptomonospora nanhaiensis]WAE73506.1 hypothetical protein OUQ99_30985 [Streptomonospora nanhaiensis]
MTAAVAPHMRAVTDTPCEHRFPRTALTSHTPGPTREQQLLDQMRGNPRVAYRIEHGALPDWMRVAEERRAQRERAPARSDVPEAGPVSAGGRHRRPRARRTRRLTWRALSYGAAVAGGALLGRAVAMSPW